MATMEVFTRIFQQAITCFVGYDIIELNRIYNWY